MTGRHAAPDVRFWRFVTPRGDCWMWTGAGPASRGYGLFFAGPARGQVQAHRWAYEYLIGPVPAGLQLDHLCRVPLCVNPDHLEPVTCAVNISRTPKVKRTACGRGHEYTAANTRVTPTGRQCRACDVDASRRRRARLKAAA